MAKLYDFGADCRGVSANERKSIAWPVAVWSCYIPESETQNLNILEHLILQLVNNEVGNFESILCKQVGFNKELVTAAIEACRDKGYFDRRNKELKLSMEGKSILGKYDNPYKADLEASKNNKKVFMVQDLVTKSVIPVFDIEKLPEYYIEDKNAIEIRYENFTGRKPRSASMKTALRYWAKLCVNRRKGILSGSNKINISTMEAPIESIEEYVPFEDEIDWQLIQDDGSVKEEEKTLADSEEEKSRQKEEREVANITILDDSPGIYYARGFIALNRNAPDEAIVISPFGDRLDDWFRSVINRHRACDSSFEEEIQLFLMVKKDELKNIIAFGNEMNIDLINRFPFISNNVEFADLKRSLEAFIRTRDRIIEGEDETHNYTENRATALQIALRQLISKNSNLLQQNMSFGDYEYAIRGLVNSFMFSQDVIRNYLPRDKSIYKNMIQCDTLFGHITGYSALFLVDAWNNRGGKSMEMLKAMPEFPQKVYEVTRPRNTSTHGKKGYAEMYISNEEAIKGYQDFEEIITVLYSRFMEGK